MTASNDSTHPFVSDGPRSGIGFGSMWIRIPPDGAPRDLSLDTSTERVSPGYCVSADAVQSPAGSVVPLAVKCPGLLTRTASPRKSAHTRCVPLVTRMPMLGCVPVAGVVD